MEHKFKISKTMQIFWPRESKRGVQRLSGQSSERNSGKKSRKIELLRKETTDGRNHPARQQESEWFKGNRKFGVIVASGTNKGEVG